MIKSKAGSVLCFLVSCKLQLLCVLLMLCFEEGLCSDIEVSLNNNNIFLVGQTQLITVSSDKIFDYCVSLSDIESLSFPDHSATNTSLLCRYGVVNSSTFPVNAERESRSQITINFNQSQLTFDVLIVRPTDVTCDVFVYLTLFLKCAVLVIHGTQFRLEKIRRVLFSPPTLVPLVCRSLLPCLVRYTSNPATSCSFSHQHTMFFCLFLVSAGVFPTVYLR